MSSAKAQVPVSEISWINKHLPLISTIVLVIISLGAMNSNVTQLGKDQTTDRVKLEKEIQDRQALQDKVIELHTDMKYIKEAVDELRHKDPKKTP